MSSIHTQKWWKLILDCQCLPLLARFEIRTNNKMVCKDKLLLEGRPRTRLLDSGVCIFRFWIGRSQKGWLVSRVGLSLRRFQNTYFACKLSLPFGIFRCQKLSRQASLDGWKLVCAKSRPKSLALWNSSARTSSKTVVVEYLSSTLGFI